MGIVSTPNTVDSTQKGGIGYLPASNFGAQMSRRKYKIDPENPAHAAAIEESNEMDFAAVWLMIIGHAETDARQLVKDWDTNGMKECGAVKVFGGAIKSTHAAMVEWEKRRPT